MTFLYSTGVFLYAFLIRIASLFNPKARQWIAGRKGLKAKIESDFSNPPPTPLVWVHVASLGEFEQGRTLIEALKKQSSCRILLTFFSPSGYEIRKNYAFADYIYYLPLDSKKNAKWFLDATQPDFAIFVKYEFWHYYLTALKDRNIPAYLISAIFRDKQIFFKWYGAFYRKLLTTFTTIFVQDQHSVSLLSSIDIQNTIVAGDTRIDRVAQLSENPQDFPEISKFIGTNSTLVAGSTWPADEDLLLAQMQNPAFDSFKFIIAPHETSEEHIQALCKKLPTNTYIRYSELSTTTNEQRILIIDTIGILSSLYQYAYIAYIGGGFGAGIHNILEPATYGIPILFGPKHQKFKEAVDLVSTGGAFVIQNKQELTDKLLFLSEKNKQEKAGTVSQNYILHHRGSTDKILLAINNFTEKQ